MLYGVSLAPRGGQAAFPVQPVALSLRTRDWDRPVGTWDIVTKPGRETEFSGCYGRPMAAGSPTANRDRVNNRTSPTPFSR